MSLQTAETLLSSAKLLRNSLLAVFRAISSDKSEKSAEMPAFEEKISSIIWDIFQVGIAADGLDIFHLHNF